MVKNRLADRINEFIRGGETQAEFAQRAGVAQSTISRIMNGQVPKFSVINRIAKNLGVTPQYLFEAIATEPEKSPPKIDAAAGDTGKKPDPFATSPANMVPVLNITSCGPLIESHDLDFPPGAADTYLPADTIDENAFYVVAKGDSMHPTIIDGDRLLIEPAKPVSNNSLVVAIINQSATVKRFRKTDAGIMLIPDNPKHEPIFIKNDSLNNARFFRVTTIVRKIS